MNTCRVKNRSASVVVYTIPEEGIRRSFAPGETKDIKLDELEKLTYQTGGMNLLTKFLQVQDLNAIQSFNMHVEPEYHMSEQDVQRLVTSGSLDEFLDALDFAPIGVVDLIKKFSITLPLTDINKREALKKKTGFDVEAALRNIKAEQEDEVKNIAEPEAPKRRVVKDAAPARRTVPSYNVVTPKGEESNISE